MGLQNSEVAITNNTKLASYLNRIMEYFGSRMEIKVMKRRDPWFIPTGFRIPWYFQHVICKVFAKS